MTFIANDCLLIKQTTVEKGLCRQGFDISVKLFKNTILFLSILGKKLTLSKASLTQKIS